MIGDDDLHAYVDGVLPEERRAELERHLAEHPADGERVAAWKVQRVALRNALPLEPLPPALEIDRLVTERRARILRPFLAAAALILCTGAGMLLGWRLHATPTGITALTEEVVATHRVYAGDHRRPVEVRAEAGTDLVEWLSAGIDHRVTLPDLTPLGYRLMGGRIVPTPHGPAAMLMYDDDHGTRLTLLVRRMATPLAAEPSRVRIEGVAGDIWVTDGIGWALAGTAPASEVSRVADEIRRQS